MEATRRVHSASPLRGWLDELLVIVLVVAALLLGWALKAWVEGQTVSFTTEDGALTVRYPASWLEQVDKDALLTVSDVRGEGAFKTTFSMSGRDMDPDYPLTQNDLMAMLSLSRAEELTSFRVLGTDQSMVDGVEARRVEYAYVDEPAGGAQNSLPTVVEAADYVLVHEGRAYILTFASEVDSFEEAEGVFGAIIASVDFQ